MKTSVIFACHDKRFEKLSDWFGWFWIKGYVYWKMPFVLKCWRMATFCNHSSFSKWHDLNTRKAAGISRTLESHSVLYRWRNIHELIYLEVCECVEKVNLWSVMRNLQSVARRDVLFPDKLSLSWLLCRKTWHGMWKTCTISVSYNICYLLFLQFCTGPDNVYYLYLKDFSFTGGVLSIVVSK